MKNELAFAVPFSGFTGTSFINCFTSAYLFLEKIEIAGEDEYVCALRETGKCSGCGSCGKTSAAMQERWFFLFDTVCGHSSLRMRFDGAPTEMIKKICAFDLYDGGTDDNIDFLFGYVGYDYRALTDAASFAREIRGSIDAGKPVIARAADGPFSPFRVITGYDGDALLSPSYASAQEPPPPPSLGELDAVYLFGEKTAPRWTFLDGLKRIREVMAYNQRENLWGTYTAKLGLYGPDGLRSADADEKRARMKRLSETMWHTFNAHNFAEVFRGRHIPELRSPALDEVCRLIGGPYYGYTHDLAWALIGLEECADWTKHAAGYFGEMIELTISQIEKNDRAVLEQIGRAIEILEQSNFKS